MTKVKYKPTPITNLTKKSAEARTVSILRVNPNASIAIIPKSPEWNTAPRTYRPGTAMSPSDNVFERPVYKSGDGDSYSHAHRAGSDAASKINSVGYST